MIKRLIKFLYKRYPTIFNEVISETFLLDVPKEISEPAFEILKEKKSVLEKYFTYQAWVWARRTAADPKNSDLHLGILVAIKSFLVMLSNKATKTEEHPTLGSVESADELLKKDLQSVDDFLKKKKE